MIRFVDLRGQDTGNRFMFWDTIADQPVGIDEFAWNTLDEFLECVAADGWTDEWRDRCASLCPDWTKTPAGPHDDDWTIDDGAPCILCALAKNVGSHGHHAIGPCMSRSELMTELAGLP